MRRGTKISVFLLCVLLVIAAGAVLVLKNAGNIIRDKLQSTLGEGFSVENIAVGWGHVNAFNVGYKKPDGSTSISVDQIRVDIDLKGLLYKKIYISSLTIRNPLLKIDSEKLEKISEKTKGQGQASAGIQPLAVNKIIISGGSVEYLDSGISKPPLTTEIRNIEAEISNIITPFSDSPSPFLITARIQGKDSAGDVRLEGSINLKTFDVEAKVLLTGLGLMHFKPYFQKKGDADIKSGTLDMNTDISVKNQSIRAPGKATLRNLEFSSGDDIKGRFLGVPRSAVIGILKDNNNTISFDFILEGDLNNPKFSLRENMVEKMTMAFAGKLGVSPSKIVESVTRSGIPQKIRKLFR